MRLSQPRWARRPPAPGTPASELSKWFTPPPAVAGSRYVPKHDSKRRDIINPDLCRQAISLIRAELPPPSTCDIVDINPGAAVWSKALHKALKPRRHVLVEGEKVIYNEALEPLLTAKRSTYRHTTTIRKAYDPSEGLLSPHFEQASVSTNGNTIENDKRRSANTQLIVTANLARRKTTAGGFSGEFSKLFFDQFYRAIALDAGRVEFHKYGLVKLLAWVPDSEKSSVMPRSATYRTRLARQIEASCHVREIVSSVPNDGVASRLRPWHGAELESFHDVAERQKRANIRISKDRRQPAPQPPTVAVEPIPKNFDLLLSLQKAPPVVSEFIKMWQKVAKLHPQWLKERTKPTRILNRRIAKDERAELALLQNRMRTRHNHYILVDDLAREQIALERELTTMQEANQDDLSVYQARLSELEAGFESIKNRHKKLFKDDYFAFFKALDDYRAVTHNTMAWNSRMYEPLLCHSEEDFYPHQPMTLLEITPKPSFVQRINSAERQVCFDYVNNSFTLGMYTTVQKMLEYLVGPKDSSAYKDFLSALPNLTNPLLGGYHNLGNVRTRTMAMDHAIDIAIAYEAWPYRKSVKDMLASLSSGWVRD